MGKFKSYLFFWRRPWSVFVYSIRSFYEEDCLYKASALTYTTLLSIVPLMSVSFTVLSSFPASKQFASQIQEFIFDSFVAGKSKIVASYVKEFVDQVNQLSMVGLLFLMVTAVLMLFTTESALNSIWRVKERRHGASAFLMYWAILTLVPFLIGISLAISSYLISLPFFEKTVVSNDLKDIWYLFWMPTILLFTAFFVLYVAVPNVKVKLLHGAIGALVATVLFSIAKWGFALYLSQYNTYELLYGAFATIPIFLVWLYLVWIVILFGAQVAHALSIGKITNPAKSLDAFTHSFLWLKKLWLAQKEGRFMTLDKLIYKDDFGYRMTPIEQLNSLVDARLVRLTINGGLVLNKNLSEITFEELYKKLPWKLPLSRDLPKHPDLATLKETVEKSERKTSDVFTVKLPVLFSNNN